MKCKYLDNYYRSSFSTLTANTVDPTANPKVVKLVWAIVLDSNLYLSDLHNFCESTRFIETPNSPIGTVIWSRNRAGSSASFAKSYRRYCGFVCYLGNQYFLYGQSEAGNVKCSYELHARSGLRFIIRQDPANLLHTVASPKTRVPQDLRTHAKESISLKKASEWAQSHATVSYDKCSILGDVGVIVKHAVCDYVVWLLYSRFG
jgi:hypothetical protein